MTGDASGLQGSDQTAVIGVFAHVHQGGDFDTGIEQVEGGQVAVVVAGQQHRALARLDRVELDQALCGAGQQYAGQVVVAKYHRLVEGASRDDALAGAHLVHPLALDYRQVVVGEPGVAGGFLEDADIGVAFDCGQQLGAQLGGTLAFDVETRPG